MLKPIKQLLAENLELPKKEHSLLPSSYQKIGDIVIIIGLLFILLAPLISDFFYIPREITIYEDKTTRMADYVSRGMFVTIGFFTVIIGFGIFLRNLVNTSIDRIRMQGRSQD